MVKGSDVIAQICFVTENLDEASNWFSDLFGMEMPPEGKAADPEEAQAIYNGAPAEVSCRQKIFKFGNIDVEIIQPGPEKSAWRDFLEKNGPGCHHIAFRTKNLTKQNEYLESKGHKLMQRGEFEGGRYAYYDTEPQLGVLIELLERDSNKEPQ